MKELNNRELQIGVCEDRCSDPQGPDAMLSRSTLSSKMICSLHLPPVE